MNTEFFCETTKWISSQIFEREIAFETRLWLNPGKYFIFTIIYCQLQNTLFSKWFQFCSFRNWPSQALLAKLVWSRLHGRLAVCHNWLRSSVYNNKNVRGRRIKVFNRWRVRILPQAALSCFSLETLYKKFGYFVFSAQRRSALMNCDE